MNLGIDPISSPNLISGLHVNSRKKGLSLKKKQPSRLEDLEELKEVFKEKKHGTKKLQKRVTLGGLPTRISSTGKSRSSEKKKKKKDVSSTDLNNLVLEVKSASKKTSSNKTKKKVKNLKPYSQFSPNLSSKNNHKVKIKKNRNSIDIISLRIEKDNSLFKEKDQKIQEFNYLSEGKYQEIQDFLMHYTSRGRITKKEVQDLFFALIPTPAYSLLHSMCKTQFADELIEFLRDYNQWAKKEEETPIDQDRELDELAEKYILNDSSEHLINIEGRMGRSLKEQIGKKDLNQVKICLNEISEYVARLLWENIFAAAFGQADKAKTILDLSKQPLEESLFS